jgi:predicted component of type VI protein secretion system
MKLPKSKSLNPIHPTLMLQQSARYIGLVTPQIYLVLLASLYMASWSWQSNLETLSAIEATHAQQRQIELKRLPLEDAEWQSVQARLKRISTRIQSQIIDHKGQKAIQIDVSKEDDIDAFREALMITQSALKGSIWNMDYLCIGQCKGSKANAILTAYKQRIEATQ